ncbi:RNA-binding protein 39-like protein, partial [Tanacetum coccineum]
MDSSSGKRIISGGSSSSSSSKRSRSSKQQKFIYDAKEGTILYVGNVRLSTTAYELRQLFEFFGAIDDVKLGTDDDGNRADYALIRFACVEDAMAAQDWNGQYEIQGQVLK